MAMFPIFMIGLVLGAVCMWAYVNLKRDVPSETRLKLLEDEITTLKNDKEMLEKCIHKKDVAIKQLKEDIQSFEERK